MQTVQDLLDNQRLALVTVSAAATVQDVVELMADHDIGALPVVEDGALVGIFTERDHARKIALTGKSGTATRVAEVMTKNPVTVAPTETIDACMDRMTEHGFRHLPVVRGGHIIGIISMKDVVRAVITERELAIEYALHAGGQKQEYLRQIKDATFEKVMSLGKDHLHPLRRTMSNIYSRTTGDLQTSVSQINKELDEMIDVLDYVSDWYFAEKAMESRRVLLAEPDRKEQIIAKMALGGSGVALDVVADAEEGRRLIARHDYEVICVSSSLIDLAAVACAKNPSMSTVFLTYDDLAECLPVLRKHPSVTNIVSRNPADRQFTVKSILTTIRKLLARNVFGLEKYLNWGVDVREAAITGSRAREELRAAMETHFRALGVQRPVVSRCHTVAEELLLNAVYDAPRGKDGVPHYDHLERKEPVQLKLEEQGTFRFACDGVVAALSVSDPFGCVDRDTILSFLEACYQGKERPDSGRREGFGRGLFISVQSADVVIFNVRKGYRTEVIALFNVEARRKHPTSSFHYFEA
jgi:predicted transcriptional regulator